MIASFNDAFKNALERNIRITFSEKPPVSRHEPTIHIPEIVGEFSMGKDSEVPEHYDPQLIAERIRSLRNNPALIKHFWDSLKEQILLGQDYRESKNRVKFLQNVVQELEVTKEYLNAFDQLSFHELEREILRREMELKKEDLENQRIGQRELDQLKIELEKLRMQVEKAKLMKQIEEIEKSPSVTVTPDDSESEE